MPTQKFFIIFLLISFSLKAQINPEPVGARSWGIGNASVTITDQWSIFNNVAGMTDVEQIAVFAAYENRFGLTEFQTFNLGGVVPLSGKWGTIGVSFSRFGDEIYNEQKIGLGYAHRIANVSLGVKVNYVQASIQELGSGGNIAFEFGGIAEVIPKALFFGAHIYNFNQSEISAEFENEKIPVVMKAGLSYHPLENLMLNVEIEKDVEQDAIFKAGLEYEIIQNLHLRTGINPRIETSYFGLGFSPRFLEFDYALAWAGDLGLMHHISLSYLIGK